MTTPEERGYAYVPIQLLPLIAAVQAGVTTTAALAKRLGFSRSHTGSLVSEARARGLLATGKPNGGGPTYTVRLTKATERREAR